MIPIYSIEQGDPSTSMFKVIIGKLSHSQLSCLIVLIVIIISIEVCLNSLVLLLCLAIGLGVERC